jgi:hypothetical protein
MATLTLRNTGDTWTPGTSLEARPLSQFPMHSQPGKNVTPQGAAAATATSDSSGTVVFSGLVADTKYVVSDAAGTKYIRARTAAAGAEGDQLDYAEITANQTGIGTSVTDVTGLSITFEAPADKDILVVAWFPLIGQVTSTGAPTLYITDGSNTAKSRAQAPSIAAGAFAGGLVVFERIPAGSVSGSVTRKARAHTSAGTLSIFAASDYRPHIRAYALS